LIGPSGLILVSFDFYHLSGMILIDFDYCGLASGMILIGFDFLLFEVHVYHWVWLEIMEYK
jgi:hypothetical protein